MTLVRRVLQLLGATLAFAVYVWFAAVRLAPVVKRRKADRRARREGVARGRSEPPAAPREDPINLA